MTTWNEVADASTTWSAESAGSATWTAESDPTVYTKLLLHLDGSDGAQTLTAATGQVVTFVGTAQLDTAQQKFGTASLLLDGDSDYVTIPDSANWHFGTGDFTIDLWVRFNDLTNGQVMCGQYKDATHYWSLKKDTAVQSNKLIMNFYDGGAFKGYYEMTGAWAGCAADTWYHLAFVRNGTDGLIFINGVSQTLTDYDRTFSTNDTGDYAAVLEVGVQNTTAYDFNGWIDEFRISKGTARWTDDFTVPAGKYGLGGWVTL